MAPTTIRKAIGAVKDQTSIGIAKMASNLAPDLEVLIVKATSHDDEPASEKHIREILQLTSYSRGYVSVCVAAIGKRLNKTRDWIVAIKCLVLVHRLMSDGDEGLVREIMYGTRRGGTRLLNLSDFRDEAHSNSWDYSAFVRGYALYLDQRLELMLFERKGRGGGEGRDREERWRSPDSRGYDYGLRDEGVYGMRKSRSSGDIGGSSSLEKKDMGMTPLAEMAVERVFGKMGHLQRVLDRFLACRPTGLAKNSRMVLVAVYPMLKESFKLYADICDVLAVLLDKFFDMENQDSKKAYDAYASAAKQVDELVGFFNWCKDIGVARSSEYPEVQGISSKLLETLEEFVRDRSKVTKSPERKVELPKEEEPVPDMNEIKALPAPESYVPPPPVEPEPQPEPPKPVVEVPLVDLRDEGVTGDDQGNKFALALFAGPAADNGNGPWGAGNPEVTSAWQNPAADTGKADWELALVESTSHLLQQKAALGGGMDPLLLNGMYDSGMVRQHVNTDQLSGGSASSVALPAKSTKPVLALPAPDGTVQTVGQDPFAASLSIPPPSYVQMAEMEKKQQLLVQEQMVWQQYASQGMQGQATLAKIGAGGYYAPGNPPMMPYGMPPMNGFNGMGQAPTGYYYAQF